MAAMRDGKSGTVQRLRVLHLVRRAALGGLALASAVGVTACHRNADTTRRQVPLSDGTTRTSSGGRANPRGSAISSEVPPGDRATIERARRIHTALAPAVMSGDQDLAPYIQEVGERLMAVGRQLDWQRFGPPGHFEQGKSDWMFSSDMRFLLVDCKTPNAFTTGGPYVYVYNGVFQQCQNEDELAAMIAHEYAHVYARHAQNKNFKDASSPAAIAYQYVQQRYTQEEENQADVLGWELYHRAGWDPRRYSAFFQRWDANRAKPTSLPPPSTEVRRAPVADDQNFGRLKNKAAQQASTIPGAQLSDAQMLFTAFPSCLMPEDMPEQRDAQRALREQLRIPGEGVAPTATPPPPGRQPAGAMQPVEPAQPSRRPSLRTQPPTTRPQGEPPRNPLGEP